MSITLRSTHGKRNGSNLGVLNPQLLVVTEGNRKATSGLRDGISGTNVLVFTAAFSSSRPELVTRYKIL